MQFNDALQQQEQLFQSAKKIVDDFNSRVATTQSKLKAALQNLDLWEAKIHGMVGTASGYDDGGILSGKENITAKRDSGDSPEEETTRYFKAIQGKLNALLSASDKKRWGWIVLMIGLCSGLATFGLSLIALLPISFYLFYIAGVDGTLKRIRHDRDMALFWLGQWKHDLQTSAQEKVHSFMDEASRELGKSVPQFKKLSNELKPISLDWADPYWNSWKPAITFPQIMRLGSLRFGLPTSDTHVPLFFSFPDDLNYLILADQTYKQSISEGIQSLLLRIVANLPPGKVRFTFIDPIGLGQNFSSFMHLADYDDALINGKVWSDPQQIEKRLGDLTEHIETVIQKYLRNKFENIDEFNKQAGEIAEPYRVLVVFDFPANFTDASARHLLSIAQNGKRCGVYTIIIADPNRELPYGFNPQDLEKTCNVITGQDGKLTWHDPLFVIHDLVMDKFPDARIVNQILAGIGEQAKQTNRVEVPFDKMFEIFKYQVAKFSKDFPSLRSVVSPTHSSTWWQSSSEEELIVPLGRSGAEKTQCLRLGKGTSQHGLVAGKTGSGKSTLFHVTVVALSMMYSPDEVELYLIDFKKGVEFKPFATHKLPHARVIAIESEREFGVSALLGLDRKLQERGEIFRSAGVDNITDFRRKTGKVMPRILLLVDEFQEFFTPDDALASQAAQILDRLVRQGRAFGLHVLLGSQTLSGAFTLARSTMDQMAVRIALQCSEADSRLILSDDNPAARLLSRPGEAIYNSANGMEEGNSNFQISWLQEAEEIKFLETIRKFAEQKNYRPQSATVVFEGNAPAFVEKNLQLIHLYQSKFWEQESLKYYSWLGEPVQIGDHLLSVHKRQSGHNLLILGQKEELAANILLSQVFSLAPQLRPENSIPRIIFADFRPPDSQVSMVLSKFFSVLSYPVTYVRRKEFEKIIRFLAGEIKKRMDSNTSTAPAFFLFVFGLQHGRDLKPEDGFGYSSGLVTPSVADHFNMVIKEGPEVGVFTSSWCDTYSNLNRSLDRQTIRDFGLRVAFQMNSDDSSAFLDVGDANKLGQFRALFLDEADGRLVKFTPYNLPTSQWFQWINNTLKSNLQSFSNK